MREEPFATLRIARVSAPVREQVEDALRDAITTGTLPPGARLSERELCASLEVSRSALREALRRLEVQELVECSPQRGVFVARPSLADAIELYELRVELEGLAARLAASFATPDQIAALESAVVAVETQASAASLAEMVVLKNDFYNRLLDASRNRLLSRSLARLHSRVQLFRGVALSEPGRIADVVPELQAIYRAVAARDMDRAERATRAHLAAAAGALASALARTEGRMLTEAERERIAMIELRAGAPSTDYAKDEGSDE